MTGSTLYQSEHKINEHITIRIPTVGDILKNEDDYYSCVTPLIVTPYDMMVQLDEKKIDYAQISDWDLFLLLFRDIQKGDLSMIFGDLNLQDFRMVANEQNDSVILKNELTGAVIDKFVHDQISRFLRQIHYLKKEHKIPANEEARKFMLDRARRRLKRQKSRRPERSNLENHIIALVNTSEFPYNYETVLGLTIYQFNASLHQIIKKIKFDNTMIGCYAGTINAKELNQDELNWFTN